MASNKRLNATITIGGAVAGSLRAAIGSTTSSLKKVGDEIKRVKTEQKTLSDAIKTFGSMGKNVDNLRARYAQTAAQLDKLTAAQQRLDRAEKARVKNAERFKELTGQIGATIATVASMGAPIVAAANFETSMLTVAKQMQGARDDAGNLTKEYFEMEKQIKSLGREFPTALGDIAQGVGNAFKQGVAKEDVLEFTRVMLKSADAMELPVDQLTEDFGKIGIMYKRANKDIGALADTINYLDDNALSTSGGIIEFMKRVGGTASMVKIADKDVAAFGSTLLTLGEREETAATAMSAVFSKLGAANTGAKSFRKMVAEIGMTTNEIEKGMQTNAVATIFKVMDQINKLPQIAKEGGTSQIDAVSTLFGMEHWDTFSKLLKNRTELEKQLKWAADGAAKGSVNKEYEARLKTTNAQWAIAKNRVMELGINIGSVLLPAVNSILGGIGKIVSKIADWSQANPALTKTIVGATVALGTFKVGLLAVRLAMFALKSPILAGMGLFARLQSGLALSRLSFAKFMPVIRQVGFALMRTPWGAVAAMAVGAGVAIYKYWDRIKAFFGGFWAGLKEGLAPVITSFTDLYKSMTWLHPVINAIGAAIGKVYDWFVKILSPTKATDAQLKAATDSGKNFGKVVGSAISAVLAPVTMLLNGLKWIKDNIAGIISSVGNLADGAMVKVGNAIDATKRFFGGGDAPANLPAQTPRAVPPVPPMRAGNTSSFAPTYNNQITVNAAPGMDTNQLANDIMNKINQKNGVKQRSSMIDGAYAQ